MSDGGRPESRANLVLEDLTAATQGQARSLILAGLREHWGSLDPGLNPELDDMLASYAAGRTVVARFGDGPILGTGTVLPRSNQTAEVTRMSVERTMRGQGIGRQIVEELVETARAWSCTEVVLETSSTWTDAVQFYMASGFTITGVEPGDYGENTWFRRTV